MKLALFDVDGTLVDSAGMITASMAAAFESAGLAAPAPATTRSIVGLSLHEAVRRLAPGQGEETVAALAEGYKQAFWNFRASGEHPELLFEGARDLLSALRARDGVTLGIATGKSRRGVDHLLAVQDLEGWFATIQTSDNHPSKPHPAMVEAALAETGIAPHRTIVIGDTSFDMEMARSAGALAIGVTWGNHKLDALRKAGANMIVHDFSGLTKALDVLWEENNE
jgi:phosphoglycolate phosphatase